MTDTHVVSALKEKPAFGPKRTCELGRSSRKNGRLQAATRGLFLSQSGFSDQGLVAFGKGKRLICMDGLDLFDTLRRGLHMQDVLLVKVRRAGEHGTPFARVRDLFPE